MFTMTKPSFAAALLVTFCTAAAYADDAARNRTFREEIRPLLERYCFDCHGNGVSEGDLDLDRFTTARHVRSGRAAWLKVLQKVQVEAMPPEDVEPLPVAEREKLLAWVDDAINNIDCVTEARPGRVTLRRLNRAEYRNTIRDLVGVDYEPADDFPADDVGYGFDNIGDVLSLPSILMEKYLDAAEAITAEAIVTEGFGLPVVVDQRGRDLRGGGNYGSSGRILTTSDKLYTGLKVDRPGKYKVRIEAFAHQAGPELANMALTIDGEQRERFVVKAVEDKPEAYEAELQLPKGEHRVAVAFLNDYWMPSAPRGQQDRNLIVNRLEIRGPVGSEKPLPKTHQDIIFVRPDEETSPQDATTRVLARFASRAFRRPASGEEVSRLAELANQARENGDSLEQSIQLALQAVLVSPHFLFRVEQEPPEGQEARDLSDYELATRLSYFLWSSMPDDELLNHAWRGTLRQGDNLSYQVQRMLRDPKSQALVDNFAEQWLNLRKFDEMEPSPRDFPAFTDDLRRDMRTETTMFFAHVVREDRSVLELLAADYTFLNERLARHYGVGGVRGEEFRQVSLDSSPRGGLVTQGSILTLTSNPTRTSPVKRGKWILENLLGEPPPPPPPNVPELEDQAEKLTGSLRQQLEQHRENPSCAVCHQQMDELGFALENFDAIGAWRAFDGRYAIDASAVLPSGEQFSGPKELTRLLASSKRTEFVRCFTENLLTYALGRGLEYYDICAVNDITAELAKNDFRFSALVMAIARSEPFRKRGVAEENL